MTSWHPAEDSPQERHVVAEQIAQIVGHGHIVVQQEFHSLACAICRATSKP
jgi:hypothetical protein